MPSLGAQLSGCAVDMPLLVGHFLLPPRFGTKEMFMNKDQREIQRELRILRYAEELGHVAKTCRYFGIGRSSFYRWRQAYAERG
jgi:hypothetical protein